MNIETKRVYLREIQTSDEFEMSQYLSNPKTMWFFDHGALDSDGIKALLEKKEHIYPIILKETNQIIGHFVYHPWFMVDTYEIGWVLREEYQNNGIITELALEVLKDAFINKSAHRVVATCQPENIPSNRVCQKIGLRQEGLFKDCIYVARLDEWWSEVFYAILASEYQFNQSKKV